MSESNSSKAEICIFGSDDLDVSDEFLEENNLEDWTCSRSVWEQATGFQCIWHSHTRLSKDSKSEKKLQNTIGEGDLHGSSISDADLSNVDLPTGVGFIDANLTEIDFTHNDLPSADFRHADLTNVNFNHAYLPIADFRHANLTDTRFGYGNLTDTDFRDAVLRNVSFRGVDLISADFRGVDLAESDLRGANISKTDLRRADLLDINANQKTKVGKMASIQSSVFAGSFIADSWDSLAQSYHDLKNTLGNQGLDVRARQARILERKARTIEAKQRCARGIDMLIFIIICQFLNLGRRILGRPTEDYDPKLNVKRMERPGKIRRQFGTWFGGVLSRYLTGYGTRPSYVIAWTILILLVTTAWFSMGPTPGDGWEGGPLYYSVVTFVTSPPHPPKEVGRFTRSVVLLETYLGTALIVLLGYVLGNRERV